MKLKMYFVMLAMGLMSFAMQGCSDDDDKGVSVPAELENAFVAKFGNVQHSWSTRGDKHVAEFNDNRMDVDAWFDANGNWLMTETDITFDALPQVVKDGYAATKYAQENWHCDDVDKLERKDMAVVYVLEVEKGNQEYDLYFNEQGNLVKEVQDVDGDDDSADYLPSALPAAVTKYLNDNYAGHRVLEVENEPNNILEVDIWVDNKSLEVRFTKEGTWVSTTDEVLYISLPELVKQAVETYKQNNPGVVLDDQEVDAVMTPEGTYYVIELEKGEQDILLKVKADGTVIQ